eukprot:GSChrysophyteH1.ASY1.ANO1.2703.1 assembled CDS
MFSHGSIYFLKFTYFVYATVLSLSFFYRWFVNSITVDMALKMEKVILTHPKKLRKLADESEDLAMALKLQFYQQVTGKNPSESNENAVDELKGQNDDLEVSSDSSSDDEPQIDEKTAEMVNKLATDGLSINVLGMNVANIKMNIPANAMSVINSAATFLPEETSRVSPIIHLFAVSSIAIRSWLQRSRSV